MCVEYSVCRGALRMCMMCVRSCLCVESTASVAAWFLQRALHHPQPGRCGRPLQVRLRKQRRHMGSDFAHILGAHEAGYVLHARRCQQWCVRWTASASGLRRWFTFSSR